MVPCWPRPTVQASADLLANTFSADTERKAARWLNRHLRRLISAIRGCGDTDEQGRAVISMARLRHEDIAHGFEVRGGWGLGAWRLETGDLEAGRWTLGIGDWRLEAGHWVMGNGDWRLTGVGIELGGHC